MAKTYRLRAPEAMRLHEMPVEEIERYVTDLAGQALDQLPEGVRPSGVNAVALESLGPQAKADWLVWAEWTRACCDSRHRIDDFINPVVDDFVAPDVKLMNEVAGQHVESQLRVQKLENPQMHGRG
jgi:hypothetical protein